MKRDSMLMESILNYFSQHPGKKYSHNQVSKMFDVPLLDAQNTLMWMDSAGMIDSEQIHGKPAYSHKSEERDTRPFVVREYKPGAAWGRVVEQIADFRSVPSRHI